MWRIRMGPCMHCTAILRSDGSCTMECEAYQGDVGLQRLMSLGLEKAMLLISSYSNPVETLEHARREGYILRDFLLTSMPFGTYSSEPKVRWALWAFHSHCDKCSSPDYILCRHLLPCILPHSLHRSKGNLQLC